MAIWNKMRVVCRAQSSKAVNLGKNLNGRRFRATPIWLRHSPPRLPHSGVFDTPCVGLNKTEWQERGETAPFHRFLSTGSTPKRERVWLSKLCRIFLTGMILTKVILLLVLLCQSDANVESACVLSVHGDPLDGAVLSINAFRVLHSYCR
jgi:hypothetical protein